MVMATISDDGYIRLTHKSFMELRFIHFHSGADEDCRLVELVGLKPSSITGYTEWISETQPVVTVGWDWNITALNGRVEFSTIDHPRSNLMVTDDCGNDLGDLATEEFLQSWIEALDWQPSVRMALHYWI